MFNYSIVFFCFSISLSVEDTTLILYKAVSNGVLAEVLEAFLSAMKPLDLSKATAQE